MFWCSFILYGPSLLQPQCNSSISSQWTHFPLSRFVHVPYVLWLCGWAWVFSLYSGTMFLFDNPKLLAQLLTNYSPQPISREDVDCPWFLVECCCFTALHWYIMVHPQIAYSVLQILHDFVLCPRWIPTTKKDPKLGWYTQMANTNWTTSTRGDQFPHVFPFLGSLLVTILIVNVDLIISYL